MTKTTESTIIYQPIPEIVNQNNWKERFNNLENYTPFSLVYTEACKAYYALVIDDEQQKKMNDFGIVVMTSGSLFRGNARSGSDIDLVFCYNKDVFENQLGPYASFFDPHVKDVFSTEALARFVPEYLEQYYPQFYSEYFNTKHNSFLESQKRRHELQKENPQSYTNKYPNHWSNQSGDQLIKTIKKNHNSIYIEEVHYDYNEPGETQFPRLSMNEDVQLGLISLIYGANQHVLWGDFKKVRNAVMREFTHIKKTNPELYQATSEKFKRITKGFLGHVSYEHFQLEESREPILIEPPSLDQIISSE